ncbi:unnamed protein product [Microthlaspi erraticum]|uniref:Uncharacterized protein n=1 Tax=Microthlaspi erraticum TaxID=1685480 RepID=A0A6D2J904_9BRAS|nr:unnamed protein product [Microthlaspi erraticum]
MNLFELEEIRMNAYENSMIYKMRTKAAHDKLIRLKDFKVGDSVLLYNSKLRLFPGKLRSKWAGPFKIHEVLPYGSLTLTQSRGEGIHRAGFRKKRKRHNSIERASSIERGTQSSGVLLMAVYHLQTTTLPPSSLGGTEAKFGGANSSSIELGVKTRKVVFWSILEHMGHEEHGGTWHMDAAQLDTQRKKGEAILKTSSTTLLDRPSFNSIELRSQQSNPKNVASPLTFL